MNKGNEVCNLVNLVDYQDKSVVSKTLLEKKTGTVTLFAFAENGDRLNGQSADDLTLTVTGPQARALAAGEDNLVVRAAKGLMAAAGLQRGAALHLEKNLPVAAGLGGGSADAAAALRLVARLWGISADDPVILAVAETLGADVPACIRSVTCVGSGRGDQLAPYCDAALAGTSLLLVNPGIPLMTGPVFAGWDRIDRGALDPRHWRGARNDLTDPAIALAPAIAELLALLAAQPGADFVRMSGSGASCFALFDSVETRDAAARNVPFWHMTSVLR